jgi:hypothetical protein
MDVSHQEQQGPQVYSVYCFEKLKSRSIASNIIYYMTIYTIIVIIIINNN